MENSIERSERILETDFVEEKNQYISFAIFAGMMFVSIVTLLLDFLDDSKILSTDHNHEIIESLNQFASVEQSRKRKRDTL
jgi:hypothetical protein